MAPESGNRYAGYLVCAGDFRIEYKAEPSRDPVAVDPWSVTGLTVFVGLGRIGAGRDAADVALCSVFGQAES